MYVSSKFKSFSEVSAISPRDVSGIPDNFFFCAQERHQKNQEIEIKKLKNELERKEKQISELSEQLAKMNEDMFANLVSIEELKTTVCEKSSKFAICENEISNLKKELHEKSQQVSNIRTSLNASDKEKKHLESKIESLLSEIKQSNVIKLKEIEVFVQKIDTFLILNTNSIFFFFL